jgi:hypothetical protein
MTSVSGLTWANVDLRLYDSKTKLTRAGKTLAAPYNVGIQGNTMDLTNGLLWDVGADQHAVSAPSLVTIPATSIAAVLELLLTLDVAIFLLSPYESVNRVEV